MMKKIHRNTTWISRGYIFSTVQFSRGIHIVNNIGPQKKSLCWSTDHIYHLYFEPLNTNLISILFQHVRVFF